MRFASIKQPSENRKYVKERFMRSDTQAGRRRRGGRRHRNNEAPRGFSDRSQTSKTPVKAGFFQRLLSFFIGKKSSNQGASANGKAGTPGVITIPNRKVSSEPASQPQVRTETKIIRKPELVEVTSAKLYVGNLSFDASESDLFELFAGVGSVSNAEVVSHRETQKSKGFAFITMASIDEAKRAVSELHDKEFMGRRLVVSGAKTNDVRDTR